MKIIEQRLNRVDAWIRRPSLHEIGDGEVRNACFLRYPTPLTSIGIHGLLHSIADGFRLHGPYYAFMHIIVNAQIHGEVEYYANMNTEPTVQEIIATNIRTLLKAKFNQIGTQKKLAVKGGTNQTTISRILGCKVGTSIDTLGGIAGAFRLEPWQLLVIDLDPKSLPVFKTLSEKQVNLYKKLVETAKELGEDTGSFPVVSDVPNTGQGEKQWPLYDRRKSPTTTEPYPGDRRRQT